MDLEELLKSNRPPKKDEITDEDLARLFMKYRGLLKQWERDKAFSAATHENIRIASAKLDELVEERTAELSKTNEQLKQAEAKLQHLNLVLRAIRSVNQLIIQEKDRDRLLKGACDNLIETRGYYNAWLAIWDESGGLVTTAEAGLGRDFLPMVEQMKGGKLSTCCQQALRQSAVVVIKDPLSTCGSCPLTKKCHGRGPLAIRLEHDKKVYGLLVTSVPAEFAGDEEEQSLLQEVAGDIAFALHDIELEEARQRAERATQEAREYAEGIAGTVREPLVVLDADLRVISANRAFYQTFKMTSEESEGRLIYELGDRQWDIPRLRELLEQILPQNTRFDDFEVEHDFPAIGRRVMLLNARRIYREANTTQMILLAIEDITERKQAEEKIKRVAEEWKTTFDSITNFISIHDKDFRLVRVNKAFADAVNMKPEELVGKTCYQVVHGTKEPVPSCPHMKTLETKKPAMAEFLEPHLGMHLEVATSPIFNGNGEVVASVHLIRDITERRKMEEQLIVTDRLASIGELSSGIAHELNNPLTSVIGFSELLLDKDVPDDVKEDLKVINREAQRTAGIVRNLLIFARKHETEKKPVNINSIIEKVLELRAYEQRVSNIQVNTQFAPDLPEITADGFHLQQVFLNIIINAEYFMTEAHGRGTLTITTERVGDIIRASFADDGPGIAEETLGHLFDPFFTTKEVGKGTGLGLSICHGIISEQGGRIYAESKLGKGATFVVELPISQ